MAHQLAGLLDATQPLLRGTGFGTIGKNVEHTLQGTLVAAQGLQGAACVVGAVIYKKGYRSVHYRMLVFSVL